MLILITIIVIKQFNPVIFKIKQVFVMFILKFIFNQLLLFLIIIFDGFEVLQKLTLIVKQQLVKLSQLFKLVLRHYIHNLDTNLHTNSKIQINTDKSCDGILQIFTPNIDILDIVCI